MSDYTEVPAREITIGDLTFTIWCEGRVYDPDLEQYRPRYAYTILSSEWRYDENDIQGPANKSPDLNVASTALLALFLTCVQADDKDDNALLFPPHVREAGQHIESELTAVCASIE
jgi:hypothetical protein